MAYKIRLEIFEGPLDLLLYLVKKNHLDIFDIPIAKITDQYLQYLELMRLLDLNIASEFLVMATTLMQIKSRMLLPQEEIAQDLEEEEDPRLQLARQLLEYKKFKEAAEHLREKEIKRQGVFGREQAFSPVEKEEVYFEASVFDLIRAFSEALKSAPPDLFYEVIKDEFTVEEKIHHILHLLLVQPELKLSELFGKSKNKLEIIASFLAILELIRLKEVTIRQYALFGEIVVLRNMDNIMPVKKSTQETKDVPQSSSELK